MEKNCYITFVDEKYVTCVIRQMQRIKHLNIKYPYIILVGEEDLYTQNKLQEHSINFNLVSTENFTTQIYDIRAKYFTDVLRFKKTFNKFKILDYLYKYDKICWVDADVIFVENQDNIFDMPEKTIFKGRQNANKLIDGAIFVLSNNLNIEDFKTFVYENQSISNTDEEILNKYFSNKIESLLLNSYSFKKILHFVGGVKLYHFDGLSYFFNDISAEDFNNLIDNNSLMLRELNIEWANLLQTMAEKTEKFNMVYFNSKTNKTLETKEKSELPLKYIPSKDKDQSIFELKKSIQNLRNSISNNN